MGKKKPKKEKIPPKVPQTVAWTRPELPMQSRSALLKQNSAQLNAGVEHYEIQVRDIETTIESIQRKCDLLVVSLEDLHQSFDWNLHEREDVHTYLKQLLYDRENDLTVLRERYLALVQKSTDVQDEHDRVIGAMHEQFYHTQDDLKNTTNSLRSRLQATSEMFEARATLTDQFQHLRRAIHEQDEAFWQKINQSEQNAICDTVEKKKQVFEYLTQLATQFRKASRQAQSIHAREMLKQNITLTTDLRIMSDQTIVVATDNHKLGENNSLLATDCSMYEDDYKMWQTRLKYFEKALETTTTRHDELQAAVKAKREQIKQQTDHRQHVETTYSEARDKLQRLQEEIGNKNALRSGMMAKNEKICREIAASKQRRQKCQSLLARTCHLLISATPSLAGDNRNAINADFFDRLWRHTQANTELNSPAGTTLETEADRLPIVTSLDRAFFDIIAYSNALQMQPAGRSSANDAVLYEEGDFEFVPRRRRRSSAHDSSGRRSPDNKQQCERPVNSYLSSLTSHSPVIQAEQRRLNKETNSA